MKNYSYGLITGFIIILIFSFNSKSTSSETTINAEDVPLIVKDSRSHEFYVEQALLWKEVLDHDKSNENAWYNLFKANRFAKLTYNSEHSPGKSWVENTEWINEANHLMKGNDIISQIEKSIPKTFMAYYLKFYNRENIGNEDFSLLEKAYAINPDFYDIYDDFIIHFEVFNNKKKRKEFNKKWFKSNDFSQNLLNYYYNVLMTLKPNSVFFCYGDNDLLASFMLQDALGVREDITVVNIPLMVTEKNYRSTIFKKLNIKPLNKDFQNGWSDSNMKEVIEYMIANKPKELPLYFGLGLKNTLKKNFEEKLYLVGLALEYSETNIDNLAELKKNYNHKYLLDYINIQFSNDDYEISLNANYIHGISLLYDHYKMSGDMNKAKEMSDLALLIANNIESPYLVEFKKNVIHHFSK
ncbi:MAG: hypothetical protein COA97_04620 [Flavobacteriales bacterium]|nr:MAG: hypothetical protein COA97_04620 [Flavobacteriales bacterium]